MEETLRYFFSAVFQGFAAIITLGIMFYLYFLDKLAIKAEKIELKLKGYIPSQHNVTPEAFTHYEREGLIEYLKKHLLPLKEGINAYDVSDFKYLFLMQ